MHEKGDLDGVRVTLHEQQLLGSLSASVWDWESEVESTFTSITHVHLARDHEGDFRCVAANAAVTAQYIIQHQTSQFMHT